MKCFIYCRQSVGADDPDDSMSLETQKAECLRIAKEREIEVLDVFREPDTSGRLYPTGFEKVAEVDIVLQRWCITAKKVGRYRPQLGRLLKRLNEVDYIICYDLTRLHRSLQGSFLENLIIQALTSHNVKVITLKEGEIDFTKFADTLVTTLTSQISSEQLKIQKDKSQAVVKRMKDTGEWNFACAKSFGYRSTGRKREVEIDPFKAEMVKTIYEMFLKGRSYYMISKEINPAYFERCGKTLFKTHMLRILRNPIYCGYSRDSSGALVKAKPMEGKEIISFSTWKKAQEILDEHRAHPKRDYKNWLPISGRVVCRHCGESVFAHTLAGICQYRCMSYSKHGYGRDHSCKCGIIWDAAQVKSGGEFLKQALLGMTPIFYMDKLKNAENASNDEMQRLEVDLLNLEKRMSTLTGMFMGGLVNEGDYKSASKVASAKRSELRQSIDEMKHRSTDDYSKMDLLIDLNELEDKSEEELTEVFKWTFKKVIISRESVEIDTPCGSLELPLKRVGKSNQLPKHCIIGGGENPIVVYYFGEFSENEEDWEHLGEIGGVGFYLQR